MSAVVITHPGRPRKLAILWIAPLQAASLFTVWAITAGGEILRSWLLTATMCLMTLPLLVGLEGTLLAMMLFEPLRGLLRRGQYLIVNTDFYSSIAVGHIHRALATFSSAEEWGRYAEVGAIVALGMALAGRRLIKRASWALCAAALFTVILLGRQRTAVFGFIVGAVALILLGARNWRRAVARLALLLLPFVLVTVFVTPPSDDEMWSKDESETVSTILTHTQRGTLKPAEEESLQIRFENWGHLLTSVIPFRPLGAGLGTSQLGDLRENRDSELAPVDNFILVVALACGIPGALLFVWILSRATWLSVRLARSDDASSITPTHRIVAAIMPALILNSIFGLTFSIYSVAPIAWLLIGWISAETLRMRETPTREIITI